MHKRLYRLSAAGIISALSVILAVLIHLPIFPAVSFLEYDPADIPIFLFAAYFGPFYGLAVTAVVSIIQGITVSSGSGIIGIIMHFLATGFFVLTECLVRKLLQKKCSDTLSLFLSLICGSLVMTVVMGCWNLLFTPLYMGISINDLMPLMPMILLFNVTKASINSIITLIFYRLLRKPLSRFLA